MFFIEDGEECYECASVEFVSGIDKGYGSIIRD